MAWIRACGGGSPSVPDGKTVTPINDVTIWQQCAGISNPTYTTLAEILADVGVLSVLMASNNAVDYLVRCKKWSSIISVPKMTSNTTPSGECGSQGSTMMPSTAWRAFDQDGTTAVGKSDDTTINNIVYYDFATDVELKSFDFKSANGNLQKFKAVYSDDLVSWTECSSEVNSGSTLQTNIAITLSGAHRYWGIKQTYSAGNCASICDTIQFYSYSITSNQYAMQYIGQNNYASNTLLADGDWRDAICNSTYFESVLNVKVPVMTSNTTPSGVASFGSNGKSSNPAYQAFDNDVNTSAMPLLDVYSDRANEPNYIQYEFTSAHKILMMKIMGSPSTSYPIRDVTCKVQVSTDGVSFDDVAEYQNYGLPRTIDTKVLNNISHNGKYWRVWFSGATRQNGTQLYFGEVRILQFYGREDV